MVAGTTGVCGGQKAQNHSTKRYTQANALLRTPNIPGTRHGPQCKLSGPSLRIRGLYALIPGDCSRRQRSRPQQMRYEE